jgi:hypothetical protein
MAASARIYASVAFAFGGQPAVVDLLKAKYDAVIVFAVHVDSSGNLFLNDTPIVSGGVFIKPDPMNLAVRLAQLRKAGMEIVFSVGGADVHDFTNIGQLLGNKPGGPGSVIYENFKALKQAMIDGGGDDSGGDIDAIDFDNEDYVEANVMINFGITLANAGYSNVTFGPAFEGDAATWSETMQGLVAARGSAFVNAIHLQCYAGGRSNIDNVKGWNELFEKAGGKAKMIAGLATVQTSEGPWWYEGKRGANVIEIPGNAQYWVEDKNRLYRSEEPFESPDDALEHARTSSSFFFYCNEAVVIGGESYAAGDAVFFTGIPNWEETPQCTGFYLGGPCSNIYNRLNGACPSILAEQFKTWGNSIDGGFIWFYDSIVGCLLSGSCKESHTALDYRRAIRPD